MESQNTPPCTFALLRRAICYRPLTRAKDFYGPWPETRLQAIDEMIQLFQTEQLLLNLKDDSDFLRDVVDLASQVINVEMTETPTLAMLRRVRAGILLLTEFFRCGATETVYKELEDHCLSLSYSITHWLIVTTLHNNADMLDPEEMVCREEIRNNGCTLLLVLAQREPKSVFGDDDGEAFRFFFVHNQTLAPELQAPIFQVLIDGTNTSSLDSFWLLKSEWSHVLAHIDLYSPEKLRCTAICMANLMRYSRWTDIKFDLPKRTVYEIEAATVLEATIPQWFALLTLAYHNPAFGFSAADFTTVFQQIARAASDKQGLASLFVESGLVGFLQNISPMKDYDCALHARTILEALTPCWAIHKRHDWVHIKKSAGVLARELEAIALESPRFD